MSNDTDDLKPESTEPELVATPEIEATPEVAATPEIKAAPEIADPIGDVSDGEGQAATDDVDAQIDAADQDAPETVGQEVSGTETGPESEEPEWEEEEPEITPKPKPPAKLERLQKILAQAGIASRRKAEEMIEQGRVQVNGKVVTELGTKADGGRDHIRVDGKLLQGAERLRYFVLNKPKGFVTTVKDPEGRPTVMQFFDKMRERLYPVGRLDYMSEGLLLVTNDGELANRLTRAAAGVEKTYLVKVAGQPTEDQLDQLRGGVTIERGKPGTGTGTVRTSPARIRQVRQGDNPWYEVVLIEGRNRELRKMFEEIGHFVEKIRRVGYGPLVLDQEPGNLRELQAEEVDALRRVAEGKLRTPKSKELRRRNAADAAMLPTVVPKPTVHKRPAKPFAARSFDEGSAATGQAGEFRPKRTFGTRAAGQGRPARPAGEGFRPVAGRPPARDSARGPAGAEDRSRRNSSAGPAKFGSARPTDRPAWKKEDRPTRPPARFSEGASGEGRPPAPRTYGAKPAAGKPYGDKPTGRPYAGKPASDRPYRDRPAGKPYGDKPAAGRTFGAKPAAKKWDKPGGSDRPAFKRPAAPRREDASDYDDLGPVRPPNLQIEEIPQSDRSSSSRPTSSRPSAPRSYVDRPTSSHPGTGRSRPDRPDGRLGSGRSSSSPRPFRGEGGLARPFATSSGKPRAGGARPSSKPTGRSYGPSTGARSGSGSGSGSIEARTGSGYRPAPGGKRSYDRPTGSRPSRPYTPRPEGSSDSSLPYTKKFAGSRGTGPRSEGARPERNAGTGWKPKTRYGPGKSSSGAGSRPTGGGASKSGYKGSSYKSKPSGSGKKRPGGKKRP
jgi:23S rRNA pseudouridine2605 synthase